MLYVQGTETASAAAVVEPWLMPELYKDSNRQCWIKTTELNTQSLWYGEAELGIAIRKINNIELIQENTARFSNRSYQLETFLKFVIPALFTLKIKPTSPDDQYESNLIEDWIPASWEGIYHMTQERDKLMDIIQKTNGLMELEENWDSYGAAVIDKDTVSKATDILNEIFNIQELVNLDPPYIFPVPDGSIQYEWHHGNKEIEIIILKEPKDKISFVRELDDQIEEGIIDQKGVIAHLLWLITD